MSIAMFPTGISYADRKRERGGDYVRVAFLPFDTLALEWAPGRHPADLRRLVELDASEVAAKRGGVLVVSGAGQAVRLGGAPAKRKLSTREIRRDIAEAVSGGSSSLPIPTVDDIARAIAYHWRGRRYDGSLDAKEYAEGIVEGRDAHVRWQDRAFAEERLRGAAYDRNIDQDMLRDIASEVARYRARTGR